MEQRYSTNAKILMYLALIAVVFVILFPFVWMVMTSLKKPTDISVFPPKFIFDVVFDNYRKLFQTSQGAAAAASTLNFPRYYLNSVIIAGFGTFLSLIIGGCAGYALTRARFRKEETRESIAFTLLSFWFGPELAIILPQYILFNKLNLLDSHIALIFVYQLIGIPFVVWMSRSFFKDVPVSLEEASRIDGYTKWQSFWKITFPLVKSGLAATAILTFIFAVEQLPLRPGRGWPEHHARHHGRPGFHFLRSRSLGTDGGRDRAFQCAPVDTGLDCSKTHGPWADLRRGQGLAEGEA